MTPDDTEVSQVTILPAQCRRLASVATRTGGAIGVSQSGSVLCLNTGKDRFFIDALGITIPEPTRPKD